MEDAQATMEKSHNFCEWSHTLLRCPLSGQRASSTSFSICFLGDEGVGRGEGGVVIGQSMRKDSYPAPAERRNQGWRKPALVVVTTTVGSSRKQHCAEIPAVWISRINKEAQSATPKGQTLACICTISVAPTTVSGPPVSSIHCKGICHATIKYNRHRHRPRHRVKRSLKRSRKSRGNHIGL
jgi:hypothetical protein